MGRYGMPALFATLTAAFVAIAVAGALHREWVITVAGAGIGVWMATVAWSSLRRMRR